MTAQELIDELEMLNPDTEIRLMSQPSWPFEYDLRSSLFVPADPGTCSECGLPVTEPQHDEANEDRFDHLAEAPFEPQGGGTVAYLVEGAQLAYGTKAAWN
jgi:hypothetical protein